MTAAFAKLSLLFVGGLALGLVVPWGFGPGKPATSSDGERTVTVRCIVEYRAAPAGPNRFGGRRVPGADEDMPGVAPAPNPVEVRVQPNSVKQKSGSDDVIVIFHLSPCCGEGEPGKPAPARSMPDAM